MRRQMFTLLVALAAVVAVSGQTAPPAEQLSVTHVESLRYPTVALFAQIQGDVELAVEINSEGAVVSVTSIAFNNLLSRAAEENVQKWKFRPGLEQKLRVVYEFKLRDPAIDQPQTECTFDLPNKVTVISNRQSALG